MEKSHFESAAFELNFFRSDEKYLLKDKAEQENILVENLADVVKFSIDSNKQYLTEKLYENFKNVTFFNTILNYCKDTTVIEDFPVFYDCELTDATMDDIEIVRQLVIDIFRNSTVGYFTIPFLKSKLNAVKELDAMQHFIVDLLGKRDKGIQFLVDKTENKIIGFTSFSIENDIVYRAYAGILESHRNNNYYEQLIYKMIQYNYENHHKAITFGVRADNIPLINKYNKLKAKITSICYIFMASTANYK